MISVFVIASTPVTQAGLRTMLTSSDIQVVGESSLPNAFSENLTDIDVVVVADTMLLENVGRTLADHNTGALVVLANSSEVGRSSMPGLSSPLQVLRNLELRSWGIVHALAWGFSAQRRKVEQDMIACARWLANA